MKSRCWKWSWIMIVSVLALTGCGQGADQDDQGETQEQASSPDQIYKNNCSSCHGQNLEGSVGPSLEEVGAQYSKKDIELIIQNGRGQMPAQNQVSKEQRATLAEWLAEKK
ncbi:cytochrome c551 [Paludifilum halophilum]|uniref:cytochrome c551 n=1 Tax=Paludifilum halophilum TaxID=1642702 RepID=UPI001F0A6154|nr:cytochrome c [Paludifilum halophilum]